MDAQFANVTKRLMTANLLDPGEWKMPQWVSGSNDAGLRLPNERCQACVSLTGILVTCTLVYLRDTS